MKRVLITGANSYIGTAVEEGLKVKADLFSVAVLDMTNELWREHDFSQYDVVFHVAGIAHRKEHKGDAQLYYGVNRDLAIETATKAREQGVKQFIILSSMSVYGMNTGVITKETKENPNSYYGKSKYQADIEIQKMQSDNFKVCILRPPMVYGRNCKGNYCLLKKIAVKTPIFPKISNERSMIYIANLVAFVEKMIVEECVGIYFPQNKEYVCTSDMVEKIADVNSKRIYFVKVFNWVIKLALKCKVNVFGKVFGVLVYEKVDLCDWVTFEESILETEK